ncbi:MAG: SDR family oxidoreductase [Bifidobacterium sp.]|nr:SDR family oxidoreductase [Bifidobacterium sp.]
MKPTHVLFIGGTGSVGQYAVEEARRQGYAARVFTRDPSRAHFAPDVEVVKGDVTDFESMRHAVDGIDGIVFTQGVHGGPKVTEAVDYGGVCLALEALDGRPLRLVLMTAIGVTNMDGEYNQATQAHDWKRRAERLVRASGDPYTIVRPGWFDMNATDEHHLVFEQGDRKRSGTAADGAVSRAQIAQVLVDALGDESAERKTLELVATKGDAQTDAQIAAMFAELKPDTGLDGVEDEDNFPMASQPQRVKEDLAHVQQLEKLQEDELA